MQNDECLGKPWCSRDCCGPDYDSSLGLWQCENKDPHDWHVVIDKVKNYECMGNAYPWGLCANKDDHRPHPVFEGSLAPFFCTAHQGSREPHHSQWRQNMKQICHCPIDGGTEHKHWSDCPVGGTGAKNG